MILSISGNFAGSSKETVDAIRHQLQSGAMEDNTIEIEIPSRSSIPDKVPSVSMYVVASIRSMSVYIHAYM